MEEEPNQQIEKKEEEKKKRVNHESDSEDESENSVLLPFSRVLQYPNATMEVYSGRYRLSNIPAGLSSFYS